MKCSTHPDTRPLSSQECYADKLVFEVNFLTNNEKLTTAKAALALLGYGRTGSDPVKGNKDGTDTRGWLNASASGGVLDATFVAGLFKRHGISAGKIQAKLLGRVRVRVVHVKFCISLFFRN